MTAAKDCSAREMSLSQDAPWVQCLWRQAAEKLKSHIGSIAIILGDGLAPLMRSACVMGPGGALAAFHKHRAARWLQQWAGR